VWLAVYQASTSGAFTALRLRIVLWALGFFCGTLWVLFPVVFLSAQLCGGAASDAPSFLAAPASLTLNSA
jgi:hypothetical protein